MSKKSEDDITREALDELEPWAEDQINRLERQFKASQKDNYLTYRVRYRVFFLVGLLCGLLLMGGILYWQLPRLCQLF